MQKDMMPVVAGSGSEMPLLICLQVIKLLRNLLPECGWGL